MGLREYADKAKGKHVDGCGCMRHVWALSRFLLSRDHHARRPLAGLGNCLLECDVLHARFLVHIAELGGLASEIEGRPSRAICECTGFVNNVFHSIFRVLFADLGGLASEIEGRPLFASRMTANPVAMVLPAQTLHNVMFTFQQCRCETLRRC